jgi:hypothetical protein
LGLANLSPPQSPPLGGKPGSSPQRGEVGRGESRVRRQRPNLGIRFRRCPVCCCLDPQKPTHESPAGGEAWLLPPAGGGWEGGEPCQAPATRPGIRFRGCPVCYHLDPYPASLDASKFLADPRSFRKPVGSCAQKFGTNPCVVGLLTRKNGCAIFASDK